MSRKSNVRVQLHKPTPEAANISRLVKPLLSIYARMHGGTFMLIDGSNEARSAVEEVPEIYCIFSEEAASAAAGYATKLLENFGLRCSVFVKIHPELLNHLATRGTFSYERRSSDRQTSAR